jgi:TPR repeat protein
VAEQYRRLAASGQPKDAFKAYAMLAACLGAQSQWQEARMQRAGDSEPGLAYRLKSGELERLATEACGDLSPRDMESRLALLKTAAEAGVPGAALDMAYLGPYGDASEIGDRWSDPVVNEWRNNVIDWLHLAAAHGDVGAMYSLSRQYETGLGLIGAADPEKALTYEWAVRVMRAAATNKPIKQPDPQLAALSARLSPDQAEAARIAGQNIAEAAMKGGK